MNKLTLTLAAALLAAGCAAPVTTAPHRTYAFTTQVSFDALAARRVLAADDLVQVTGKAVHHVEVYMRVGKPATLALTDLSDTAVWSKATVESLTYDAGTGLASGASITFGNLDYDQTYTIVAVAKGDDPNTAAAGPDEVLNDANLFLSASELVVPAGVNGTYQQTLDPTVFDVLHPFDAAGAPLQTSVSALIAKLRDVTYAGHADNVGVAVQDGVVQPAEGDATLKVDDTLKLAADSGTSAAERMGFWNFTALQDWSNTSHGLDSHMTLRAYGLKPNAVVNRVELIGTNADGVHSANTVGYLEGVEYLGVCVDDQPRFANGVLPTANADGALRLDFYLDPGEVPVAGYRFTAGTVVSVKLFTDAGDVVELKNVTL